MPVYPTSDTDPVRHVAEVFDVQFQDRQVFDSVGLLDHAFFL